VIPHAPFARELQTARIAELRSETLRISGRRTRKPRLEWLLRRHPAAAVPARPARAV